MKLIYGSSYRRPLSLDRQEEWGRQARNNIAHQRGSEVPDEPALLALADEGLNEGNYPLTSQALRALYGVVTASALPTLEQAMYFPDRQVKETAFDLIVHAMGSDGSPQYLSALRDKRYPYKAGPVSALGRWGGSDAIDDVTKRAKTVLRNPRRWLRDSRFELVQVVQLLSRHLDDERAGSFLNFLSTRWDRVLPHERWSIAELLLEAGAVGVWAAEPVAPPLQQGQSVWDMSQNPPLEIWESQRW